jgi:hypothetical protein
MNIKKWIPRHNPCAVSATALLGLVLLFIAGFPEEIASITPEDPPDAKESEQIVNAAITRYEPALAIRGAGCITCHAKIHSAFITDFGYGDPFFFGNASGGIKVGPFNGNIYGDFIAEQGKTSWLTAEMDKEIIIPQASLSINPKDAAGSGLNNQSSYHDALQAASLKNYLQSLESQKTNPAPIVEKDTIFIGAPDTATLETRFGLTPGDSVDFKYIKNNPKDSPEIEGIELSESGNYYTNTSDIVCDGDLFVRGILFLNKPSIRTNTGCRIYAAGPIFFQNTVAFNSMSNGTDRTNLQLVSTEAVFMGVGQKKCGANAGSDPLSSRLLLTPALTSIITRSADRDSIQPEAFAQKLYDKAALIPLEDSSCHDESIRFSRILINAPIVHSRYNGKFRGLVIAEFALFWQGKSSYEFDPIFKEVPVLPLLKNEDYLLVE